MNVKKYFLELLARILKESIPLPPLPQTGNSKAIAKYSVIDDIQKKLAEIAFILEREAADESLDLAYQDALLIYPKRMESILNLICVLALSIKTKININNIEPFVDADFFKKLDLVCFDCFNIKAILNGVENAAALEEYQHGIRRRLQYSDYKTGYIKNVSPGLRAGQLMSTGACSVDIASNYLKGVELMRVRLDSAYKPKADQNKSIYSSSPEMSSATTTMFKGIFAAANAARTANNNPFIQALLRDDIQEVVSVLRTCKQNKSLADVLKSSSVLQHAEKDKILSNLRRIMVDLLSDDHDLIELNLGQCEEFFSQKFIDETNKSLELNRRYVAEKPKQKLRQMQTNALTIICPEFRTVIGEDTDKFPKEIIYDPLLTNIEKISENANRLLRRLCTTSHPKALQLVKILYRYESVLALDFFQENKDNQCAMQLAKENNPEIYTFFEKHVDDHATDFFRHMAASTRR